MQRKESVGQTVYGPDLSPLQTISTGREACRRLIYFNKGTQPPVLVGLKPYDSWARLRRWLLKLPGFSSTPGMQEVIWNSSKGDPRTSPQGRRHYAPIGPDPRTENPAFLLGTKLDVPKYDSILLGYRHLGYIHGLPGLARVGRTEQLGILGKNEASESILDEPRDQTQGVVASWLQRIQSRIDRMPGMTSVFRPKKTVFANHPADLGIHELEDVDRAVANGNDAGAVEKGNAGNDKDKETTERASDSLQL